MGMEQLLAALVYLTCTNNGMACDAATLIDQGKCLVQQMGPQQLWAALVYLTCTGGGGGGGSFTIQTGVGPPTGATPTSPPFYQDITNPAAPINYNYANGTWGSY